ncbi:hypothetical protein ONZ45_g10057 [Pleurotus djamor]|nr:hypothetical protein ONZ45_g10057 [Pleurotus djamor]
MGRFETHFRAPPRYAILSHRWDVNELSFAELSDPSVLYASAFGRTFTLTSALKFHQFCKVAWQEYGCRYVWMDSACINQEDIDELDKSIHSIYWWYKNAYVCIVYLRDALDLKSLTKSSWFTRGWTLQELLAPERLSFYYGDWTRVSSFRFDVIRRMSGSDEHSSPLNYDVSKNAYNLRKRIAKAAGNVLHTNE